MALRRNRGEEPLDEGHDGLSSPDKHVKDAQSGGFARLFIIVLVAGYIATFLYFRTVTSKRDDETRTAVNTLEQSFAKVEGEMKQMATELKERKRMLEEKQKSDQEKDALIAKLQNKIEAFAKVEDRLQESNLVQSLQKQTRVFNYLRWGEGPIRVRFELEEGDLLVESAPLDLMPHATHWFLTLVETGFWDGCHVIRNAAHVMQLNCNYRSPRHERQPSVAFQEYSPEFKHVQDTLGVAGRPGGPDFYFNLLDNVANHGPGGQGPEADPCFAKLVSGREVLDKLHKRLPSEFLPKEEVVLIKRVTILNAAPQGRAGLSPLPLLPDANKEVRRQLTQAEPEEGRRLR